jgi:hypothetical protein
VIFFLQTFTPCLPTVKKWFKNVYRIETTIKSDINVSITHPFLQGYFLVLFCSLPSRGKAIAPCGSVTDTQCVSHSATSLFGKVRYKRNPDDTVVLNELDVLCCTQLEDAVVVVQIVHSAAQSRRFLSRNCTNPPKTQRDSAIENL